MIPKLVIHTLVATVLIQRDDLHTDGSALFDFTCLGAS